MRKCIAASAACCRRDIEYRDRRLAAMPRRSNGSAGGTKKIDSSYITGEQEGGRVNDVIRHLASSSNDLIMRLSGSILSVDYSSITVNLLRVL